MEETVLEENLSAPGPDEWLVRPDGRLQPRERAAAAAGAGRCGSGELPPGGGLGLSVSFTGRYVVSAFNLVGGIF